MNRRVNTNFSIFIILVVSSLLVILDFFIIGHKLNGSTLVDVGSSSVDEKKDVLNDDDEDVVDVIDSKRGEYISSVYYSRIYSENVDGVFKYDSYKYHIVVDADSNTIKVDDKVVFSTNNKIFYVYMVKDILIIQDTNSFVKDNLYFIDMDGNEIKTINDIAHNAILVTREDIKYFVQKCDYSENDIFKSCAADAYNIKYLGEKKLSEPVIDEQKWSSANITNCDMDLCTMYDKDNLKIEFYSAKNSEEHTPAIVVNGNYIRWSEGYRLTSVEFTSDKYLYIETNSGTGNGLLSQIFIADLNGNIITKIDEKSLSDIDMYNYHSSFENNSIVYHGVYSLSSIGLDDRSLKSYDDIVYVKDEYQYVGGGKVSKVQHVEKTYCDYIKELTGYGNCQDAINNIDSWKSKDDIYKFYGIKWD